MTDDEIRALAQTRIETIENGLNILRAWDEAKNGVESAGTRSRTLAQCREAASRAESAWNTESGALIEAVGESDVPDDVEYRGRRLSGIRNAMQADVLGYPIAGRAQSILEAARGFWLRVTEEPARLRKFRQEAVPAPPEPQRALQSPDRPKPAPGATAHSIRDDALRFAGYGFSAHGTLGLAVLGVAFSGSAPDGTAAAAVGILVGTVTFGGLWLLLHTLPGPIAPTLSDSPGNNVQPRGLLHWGYGREYGSGEQHDVPDWVACLRFQKDIVKADLEFEFPSVERNSVIYLAHAESLGRARIGVGGLEGGFTEIVRNVPMVDHTGRSVPHVIYQSDVAIGGPEGMRIRVVFPSLE